jgi:hypothetical protein
LQFTAAWLVTFLWARWTHVKKGGKLQIPGRSNPVGLVVGLSFFPRALGSVPALLVPTDVDMLVC